jgi:hypothetical protein
MPSIRGGSRDVSIRTNLVLLLEPGEPIPNALAATSEWIAPPPEERAAQKPLRGAEIWDDPAEVIQVALRVVDRDSGDPVPSFKVTPGYIFENTRRGFPGSAAPALEYYRELAGTNGSLSVLFQRRNAKPVMKVEAEGFLPLVTPALEQDQTALEVKLAQGRGPSGTVLLPDGTAAAGLKVVLLAGRMQVPLHDDQRLSPHVASDAVTTTDSQGRFSLPTRLDADSVVVAGPDGFAQVPVSKLEPGAFIRLQPWGSIRGRLVRDGKPVADESLGLGMNWHQSGRPLINLQHQSQTDADGRFEFRNVPPADIQLHSRIPLNKYSWRLHPLRQVTVFPGRTTEVEIEFSQPAFGGVQSSVLSPRPK